jgi:hypothetical protein
MITGRCRGQDKEDLISALSPSILGVSGLLVDVRFALLRFSRLTQTQEWTGGWKWVEKFTKSD